MTHPQSRETCRFGALLALSSLSACAGSSQPPPKAGPQKPASSAIEAPEPARSRDSLHLPVRTADAPPPPARCQPEARAQSSEQCPAPHESLMGALNDPIAEAARGRLRALQSCSNLTPGLAVALLAEHDAECADIIVEPYVGALAAPFDTPLRQELVALGIAARLGRLAVSPPSAPTEVSKVAIEDYLKRSLFPWISLQAEAIFEASRVGADLTGMGRGIVAVEAGMADMRFVEIARAVPVPEEIQKDPELFDVYSAALEDALEARKARGRDAALVGLEDHYRAGVTEGPRLDRARKLLSEVFGGKRMVALDTLLLPSPMEAWQRSATDSPASGGAAPEASPTPAASRPPVWLEAWMPSLAPSGSGKPSPTQILGWISASEHALSASLERELAWAAESERRLVAVWAAALLKRGRIYFKTEDFQKADRILSAVKERTPLEDYLRALAIALSAGPKNALELLARGPRFADALGNLAELDRIAAQSGPHQGQAAFAAAYLRELVVPPESPEAWKDLGSRYRQAAKVLTDKEKTIAEERALAAAGTEAALRKKKRP